MLIARVRETLARRGLLRGARKVLVGCSGGPDSQALLHVLHHLRAEHGCALSVAAVDHGLRPQASAELAFALALARELGVAAQCLTVRVEAGPSLQAQARKARYRALIRHAAQVGADRIAVGHTCDDQAETVMAKLLRGGGVAELSAIAPRRADGVVRPLIDASRAEVETYLSRHGLPCARDPSNEDPRFLRARVRHGLLTHLRQERPDIVPLLARLSDDARDVAEVVSKHADDVWRQEAGMVAGWRSENAYIRRLLLARWAREAAGAQELQRHHLESLDQLLMGLSSEARLPGDLVVRMDGADRLVFVRGVKRGRGRRRHS